MPTNLKDLSCNINVLVGRTESIIEKVLTIILMCTAWKIWAQFAIRVVTFGKVISAIWEDW